SRYVEAANNGRGRQVGRRRKLSKKDDMLRYKMERIPFLEEQVRKIKEGGKLLTMDIERLLLSEDNRFDFVNEVAAEAKEYVESNRDEYGGKKKAILHVLSNRVNDLGFYRPDAYEETDPFKPGPTYLKEEFT
ncbi:protein PLASTID TRANSCRIPTIONALLY ACTIVE 7, partial [Pistacia vera]|uniref:protein PLASTID TRANSCRIPTIONALLY ACTIVE 7 n=1 Tax=Pistacia vera TaxID=55513 RepID=UPI0012637550